MSAAEGFEEFVTIVEQGSVTAAAQALGLPRPTLSRRLARLEERLDVRLIHRTTRRMTLTEAGERLFERAQPVVRQAREAEAAVRRLDGVPRGLLRVSVPTGLYPSMLAQWAVDFLEAWPEVRLEVMASSAHVDLVGEGFDLALRRGPVDDPSLIVRTLVHDERVAVASPAYLEARGTPCAPDDLAAHDCIVGYRSGTVPETRWPLLEGGTVSVSGTLIVNQMAVRLEAARRHHGIAFVGRRLARHDLAEGRLVQVLPGVVGRKERMCLAWPDREYVDPKVVAFADFLTERFREIVARG